MTTASQTPVRDRRSEERLASLMTPWVDKTIGLIAVLVILSVAGCGGGGAQKSSSAPGPYTIGGSVVGLSGSGLVLEDNGGNDLTLSAGATSFTFSTAIATGGAYSVTVLAQPSPTRHRSVQ